MVGTGLAGATDKARLLEQLAWDAARSDDRMRRGALALTRPAGNDAGKAIDLIEQFAERLPYRREPGEIFESAREVLAGAGGDCDGLTGAVLALLYSLGWTPGSARAEVFVGDDGVGYHVRARVGLPIHSPPRDWTQWRVVDPVWRSEREWGLSGAPTPSVTLAPAPPSQSWSVTLTLLVLAAVAGWWAGRRWR